MARHVPTPRCPVRPGEPCGLCHPGATGPADCGVVYLAMSDPDLREEYVRARALARERAALSRGEGAPGRARR